VLTLGSHILIVFTLNSSSLSMEILALFLKYCDSAVVASSYEVLIEVGLNIRFSARELLAHHLQLFRFSKVTSKILIGLRSLPY